MGAVPTSTTPMSIQATHNMSTSTSKSIQNRFAALAVDDEPPATAAPSQQAPRRAYMPPNLRRNQQQQSQFVPVTQSRLTAPPNVKSTNDFPSLGSRHTPVAAGAGTASTGWASRARNWAAHDEHAAEIAGQERRRREHEREQQSMITLSRPTFRTARPPTFAPGTSEFVHSSRRYVPSYAAEDADENDTLDAAEAYVGGYDHSKYAFDYAEDAADQYGPCDDEGEYNDGRYTPPYPPNPY